MVALPFLLLSSELKPILRYSAKQTALRFHASHYKLKGLSETGKHCLKSMSTKAILKSVCGLVTVVVFSACSGCNIEGKWVEPIPGMESQMQGIHLEKGGKATSINMATLQYEKWEKQGDMLILSGKSIGNSQTIDFADTLTIINCTSDHLSLQKGNLTINYQKQK
jgi:hypothetical protein